MTPKAVQSPTLRQNNANEATFLIIQRKQNEEASGTFR